MGIIGISSNACMDLPLERALETLSAKTGFVEIMSGGRHSLFTYGSVLPSFSLRYSVHCPVSDGNIAEPNERIRKASVQVIADIAGICDDLGVETLVLHPGYCLESDLFPASEAALEKSIAELGKIQEEYTVRFAMENMGSLDCLHFRYPSFLSIVRGAGLGFCLDVGHAYLNGVLDEFLQMHPDHLHLHDNTGTADSHAACGSGSVDFATVLSVPVRSAVIECMTMDNVDASLSYFADRL
ncbi:MAG TPA: sugar phosphate isomerase/epimerase [Methanocorpusculum sp.]|nr:sugar phosphate isomerase/epimerase [Methanocorpusculum sp.]